MKLYHGDCVEILPALEADSIDAVVTDPPYELTNRVLDFHGCEKCGRRTGGRDGIVTECPRCGGNVSRQRSKQGKGFMGKEWDSTGVAFQPQTWAEILRVAKPGAHMVAFGGTRTYHRMACAIEDAGWQIRDCLMWLYGSGFPKSQDVSKAIDRAAGAQRETTRMPAERMRHSLFKDSTRPYKEAAKANGYHELPGSEPATPEAAQWAGWGTALKPAWEPIILARKPLRGTVAANVLEHGTGGLNIDAARIPTPEPLGRPYGGDNTVYGKFSMPRGTRTGDELAGRWPANVALDETAAETLQESRFYYTSKAPADERPRINGIAHPTVKPLDLIQWLLRLICPRGGTVLDPFAGSGTTGEAAMLEGMQAVLIEREADYLPLILARAEWFKS